MDKQEFARRVTQMQGSLYRVAASYLRGERIGSTRWRKPSPAHGKNAELCAMKRCFPRG